MIARSNLRLPVRFTSLRSETHRLQELIHARDLELGEEAALFRGQSLEG